MDPLLRMQLARRMGLNAMSTDDLAGGSPAGEDLAKALAPDAPPPDPKAQLREWLATRNPSVAAVVGQDFPMPPRPADVMKTHHEETARAVRDANNKGISPEELTMFPQFRSQLVQDWSPPPMVQAQPDPASPKPIDEEAELQSAQASDAAARRRMAMERGTRELVAAITRQDAPTELVNQPGHAVDDARKAAAGRRADLAAWLERKRQGTMDDSLLKLRDSEIARNRNAPAEKAKAEAESARRFDISHQDAQANAAATRALAGASLGLRKQEIEKRDEDSLNDDVQKLGKELPGDVADFNSKYEQIKGAIGRHPGDIPGVGKWDANKPDFSASDDDLTVKKAAGQMLASYQKLITGVGASDAERANLAKISLDLESEKGFAAGLESLKQAYEAKVKDVRSRFRPEVVAKLEQGQRREGVTPPAAAPTQAPTTKTVGKVTYEKRKDGKWYPVGK
jgi:hypothetical protein